MSDPTSDHSEGSGASGPVIRDRRRLDPETGQLRDAYETSEPSSPASQPNGQASPSPESGDALSGSSGSSGSSSGSTEYDEQVIDPVGPDGPGTADVSLDGILADLDAAQASAAERLSDLQRLQAEFVNYRRRVDRDRDVARDQAVSGVLEALLPVLDDIHLARQHGDLDGGPFAAIAEKLEAVLQRFGLSRYGEQGEEFDPAVHEALMHTEAELPEGTKTTTVVQVLQPGYRTGDRVLRAARVAVADPN
jgi:molecular chaperone GrpE